MHAQSSPGASQSRGSGWLPRHSNIDTGAKLTAAERKQVLERLNEIERILLKVDEIARPVGFDVEPSFHVGNEPGTTGNVIASRYALTFYAPSRKVAGEGYVCIEVAINVGAGTSVMPYRDEQGEIHFEHELGDAIPGATHVWERLSPTKRSWTIVAFTSGRASPWKSVSRETFLRSVVYAQEGEHSKDATEYRKLLLQTPYQRWMTEASERKKNREALIAQVQRASPDQGAQLRKTLEDTERETAARLKASESSDRADNARTLATPTLGERLHARIAAMSPADRAAPAWLDRMDTSGDFVFVAPGSPNAFHVVRRDPSFFRARRSRVEARLITVKISASLTGEVPAVHQALNQVYRQLDWPAIAQLVDER